MMATPAQHRKWQQEESRKREALRPTRNAVNKALRGLPHSKTYSTRIRGWNHWTFGWESHSDIYYNLVRVDFNHGYDAVVGKIEKKRMEDLKGEAFKRLQPLGGYWQNDSIIVPPMARGDA